MAKGMFIDSTAFAYPLFDCKPFRTAAGCRSAVFSFLSNRSVARIGNDVIRPGLDRPSSLCCTSSLQSGVILPFFQSFRRLSFLFIKAKELQSGSPTLSQPKIPLQF